MAQVRLVAADGTPVSAVLPTSSSGSTGFPLSYSGGQLVQVSSADLSKLQWIAPTVPARMVPVIKPVSGLVRIDANDSNGSIGPSKDLPQKYVIIQNPIVQPPQQHQVTGSRWLVGHCGG